MVLSPASRGAPAGGRISSVSPKKDDQGDDVTNAVLQLLTTGAGSAELERLLDVLTAAVAPGTLIILVHRLSSWTRL
jgi:hypothetical protein